MTKSSSPSTTRYPVLRFLLEEPGTGWREYHLKQGIAAYQEALQLPALAGRLARIAFAHLTHDGDGMLVLGRLSVDALKFDDEGRVDEGYLTAQIVARIDPYPGPIDFSLIASVPVSVVDVQAICGCIDVPVPPRFQVA